MTSLRTVGMPVARQRKAVHAAESLDSTAESARAPAAAVLADVAAEARLLALTAGGARNDAFVTALLAREIDAHALRRLTVRERAAGPLVRHLRRLNVAAANELADSMSSLARLSDVQALFLHGRLRRIQQVLADRGIDILLLKGAGLAHTLYASPLERPMADLDLLVRPDRAAEAVDVALHAGWVRRRDVRAESDYTGHHHLVPLEDDQDGRVGLEFHVELFSRQAPFVLPASDVWRAARPLSALGSRVLVPDPHHQLLHACVHFTWSHELTFGAWRTIRDIELIAGSGGVDWRRFVGIASASRGATCSYWALRLARDLGHVPIPGAVLDALAPAGPAWVLDSLTRHFAHTCLPVAEVCPSIRLSRTLWRVAVQPGMQRHGRARPWFDVPGSMLQRGDGHSSPDTPAARLGQITGYLAGLLPRRQA